ncbi:hypothetical protein LZ31DRAFT_485990 [Colletotrichum somersetense]|nr:hypothetical protein LZ31DRAFT_485990 [Colletotrichum somersetense]
MLDTKVLRRGLHQKVHTSLDVLPAPPCGSDKDSPVTYHDRDDQGHVLCVSIRSGAQSHGQESSNAVILFAYVRFGFGELHISMAPGNVGGIRIKHDCGTAGLDLLGAALNARALVENNDDGG